MSNPLSKTELILATDCPYKNSYQGKDKRVLFVCSVGLLRSPTAARIYSSKYNTRCAGSYQKEALVPVSGNLLLWADEVVFVNSENYIETSRDFDLGSLKAGGLKITTLHIPDDYGYMAPRLIEYFIEQYGDI